MIPSRDYRDKKVKPDHAPVFDLLPREAAEPPVMAHKAANRPARETANTELLKQADRLIAIWNAEPPSGESGGTADVVAEVREASLPVDVA